MGNKKAHVTPGGCQGAGTPATPTVEMEDDTCTSGGEGGATVPALPVSINELRAMAADLRECVRTLEAEREGEVGMVRRYTGSRPVDDEVKHVRARYNKVILEKQELAEAYELQAETLMSVPVVPYSLHLQAVEAAGKAKDRAVMRLKREMEVLRKDQMNEMEVIRTRAGKREMDLERELSLVRRDLDQVTGKQTRAPRGSSLARSAREAAAEDDDDNNNGKGKHIQPSNQPACVSLGLGAFFGL